MKQLNRSMLIAAAAFGLTLAGAQVQAQPGEARGQGVGQGQSQGQGQSRGQGQGQGQGQSQEHRQQSEEPRRSERRQESNDRRDGDGRWESRRGSNERDHRDGRREGRGDWERERTDARNGPRIDEQSIRRYFGERRDWIEVDRSRDSLPPGIRMNLERGKPLPPGIAKKFDDRLARDLPRYEGYEWRRVGPDVILVEMASDIVYEVLRDILY